MAAQISAIMKRVRSTDTSPEVLLRETLEQKGLTCETNAPDVCGKPDIVFRSKKLAIFVDGDFWHGGQWIRRGLSAPEDQFRKTATRDYWIRKIHRTAGRDIAWTNLLLKDGWTVLRFWESDIVKRPQECVEMIAGVMDKSSRPHEDVPSLAARKTFAEFFAGVGLMRMGLERQDWSVAYANDIDPQKLEMYRAQFPDAEKHFFLGDVHQLPPSALPEVTLATACFPCNDLSLAGSRSGLEGKQSSAFWGFIRMLQGNTRKPPLVLLENVPGFLTSHGGADFAKALLTLNELGYEVDSFIIDAAHFVPQSRSRLFVVGVLRSADQPVCVNDALCDVTESAVRPKALADFIRFHREICWNIRTLPGLPRRRKTIAGILERLPDSAPEWWNAQRAKYLLSQMSPKHRKTAAEMITGKKWSYGTVFRRIRHNKSMAELRSDGIAGCLRTPRGGSAKQILFKAGKGKYFVRHLTPRECARLMGADDYQINVGVNQALFGFGDAVCVPVIEWIAKYYLNPVLTEMIHSKPIYPFAEIAVAHTTKSA